ncbi:MAG: HEAT repeat domain-containing protein [Thermomicrobiales bacterium]|jgi:HEAT repeat protein
MTQHPDDDFDGIRVFAPETDDDVLDASEDAEEPKPGLDEVEATLRRGVYPRSVLIGLSDLSARDVRQVRLFWDAVAPDVRIAVVSELNDLAEERVDYLFGRVLRSLLDDPEPAVRQHAITGLWEVTDPDLALTLIAMLNDDPSEDVRAEAARALARYAEQAELGECDDALAEQVRNALLSTIEDSAESLHVRARALEAASVFARDERIHSAIDFFFDEDDTGFRATALYAMGRSMNSEFLPRILNETASDDAELRFESARAAGRLGDTTALPVLADLAGDDDAEVRQAAINALGEVGGKAAIRLLRSIAESAPEADEELLEAALEEASAVVDPLLLDTDDS